jgi:DNA-binding response OmpR family regulator
MQTNQKLFVGRDRVVSQIVQGVLAMQPQSFSLVGPKLVGKSQLVKYLADEQGPLLGDDMAAQRPAAYRDSSRVIVTWIDCDWQDAQVNLIGWIYQRLREQVHNEGNLPISWQRIEAQPSDSRRIWQLARDLKEQDMRLVLLLDNFDRVFESQLISADAMDELRPLTFEMALLVATEQPLHDLDRELAASPLFNVMTQLFLGLLEPQVARTWVLSYGDEFPIVHELADELVALTGQHPFLLRRLGEILIEVRQMLPPGSGDGAMLLPLVRLRLAEHGRLLFETIWRRLQHLPARLQPAAVQALMRRLARGGLPLPEVPIEQTSALNWLINQAVVTCCNMPAPSGYQLFTPLFTEFLARRLEQSERTAAEEAGISAQGAKMPAAGEAPSEPGVDLDQFTKIEASLLRYFQSHQNETVSTEQLLADVWKRPDATNRRVQEAIRRLRLHLEAANPPIGAIENDRGRGYRFTPAGK